MDKITKDMAGSLNLSDSPGAGNSSNPIDLVAAMAKLPPALQKNLTVEETVAELKNHPFFMTDLETGVEDNNDIAALQALSYEGTPLENSLNFKEQGNEVFRNKQWFDAKEFYTKGVFVLEADEQKRRRILEQKEDESFLARITKKIEEHKKLVGSGQVAKAMTPEDLKKFHEANDRQMRSKAELASKLRAAKADPKAPADTPSDQSPTWDADEIAKQRALLEQLYVNRAACHMKLGNHRSCTLDCARTLRLNPRNIKAFFRSSQSLLKLNKISDAQDSCEFGLRLDPTNASLLAVAKEIAQRAAEIEAKRQAEEKRTVDIKARQRLLSAALQARGIKVRSTDKPPEMEDARIRLVPDEDDPKSTLSFPTMILYPTHMESDFIKAFNETETLEQHFGYVFPLPWDFDNVYSTANVECYMETILGGLFKIGKKLPLLKLLNMGGSNFEIVDDLLKIFVVPKDLAPGWIKEYKEKKALMMKGGNP